MLRVTVPQSMKLATIWAVWGFLAIGALGWGLLVIVSAVSPGGNVADWVQAVGSIVAIIGAAAFPYLHESHRERRQQNRAWRLLRLLAERQEAELLKLWTVVFDAARDFGEQSIAPYLDRRSQLFWPSHIAALETVPIADLDPHSIMGLGELKVGAAFAALICGRLEDWDIVGHQEILDTDTLFRHCQTAQIVSEGLRTNWPEA